MSPALATFVFETINFLLLAAGLAWVFTKPMRKILDEEIAARANAEKAAKERDAKLARAEAELAQKRESWAAEAERLKDAVEKEAADASARIVADGHARVAEERARLDREIEGRRRAEVDALAAEVGKAAAKVVLDVFASAAMPEADAMLVRASRTELSDMVAHGAGHVVIECARPLEEGTRSALRVALGAALDDAETRVVPDLVAGVRVSCDRGLVDASASGLAHHTASALGGRAEVADA